jgi:PEP-CTERM/exosortase A-associated glycosyltransferase
MNKVLHVLDHSLPEQSGYASRSHSILRALLEKGVAVSALTGPKHSVSSNQDIEIDGVAYRRTPNTDNVSTSGVIGQLRTISMARAEIRRQLRQDNISMIHAHSPCLNGLAALGHGVPLLYEMRSSWEDAAVSEGTTAEGSARYRVSRMLENTVARSATAVVVICDGLKTELIDRGISREKIHVVPNAVPSTLFERPDAKAVEALRKRFGLMDKQVIGYFGSFFDWEGVDALIEAMVETLNILPDVRLLLAGGGRQEESLRSLAQRMGIADKVIFAGRFPAEDVKLYYSIADIMVFPRKRMRLTDMVTPLKPLEAMAMGVPLVVSDVGGHRELVKNEETGFLYRAGNNSALTETIVRVLQNTDQTQRVVQNARSWVEQERRWSTVSDVYTPIYQDLALSK